MSTKEGHQSYVTIISAKTDTNSTPIVVDVISGRSKEDVKSFLESIPNRLKKTVNQVCTDMYDEYVNAAIEVFGVQSLVVDRYHVAKLYRKPLDKLRIKEVERLKSELSTEEYTQLEGMMWVLRKKRECLTKADKNKLEFLYKNSSDLKKAHSCALRSTNIFNTHCSRKSAMAKMNRWIRAVEKSELIIFNVLIRTLKE